jgi:hypothetical protein
MKMKKGVFALAGFISVVMALGLIFIGCASTGGQVMFEDNIPKDQQATFQVIGGYWDVYEFSGKPVKWYKATIFGSTNVIVPAGQHTVKFNCYYDAFNRYYDKELTAVFKAGHTYSLQWLELFSGEIYFGITEDTINNWVTPMPTNNK